MSHTYNTALLFTRSKTSSHVALVRCFQLASSLGSISLDNKGGLRPSRRRSLFTMSCCMLIFSARAGNLPELIPIVKSSLTDSTMDPYLELVDDIRLQAVTRDSVDGGKTYGTEEDNVAALRSLSVIATDDQKLKEAVMSHLMSKFEKLSEDELFGIKKQLHQGFLPDESYPMRVPLFMETPQPCSPLAMAVASVLHDGSLPDTSGSQYGGNPSVSSSSHGILSANQLLESVQENAQEVASMSDSTTLVPYDQMKNQCEALVTGKQQKMSVLHNIKCQQNSQAMVDSNETDIKSSSITAMILEELEMSSNPKGKELILDHEPLYPCSLEYEQQPFRLPPASPYDKFLKAAGC